MASGATLIADLVVLAIGHPAPPLLHPDAAALKVAGLWRCNPWEPTTFTDLDPQASVLLVGTGLTMVNAVVSLLDAGHAGPIHALSRHGLLPRRHVDGPPAPIAVPMPLPRSVSSLTRWIRSETDRATQGGVAWQSVIDALRPVAQEFWRGLSIGERQRFLRHLRAWWDVHRHRVAPQIADRMEAAQTAGQLQVRPGRIVACNIDGDTAAVAFRNRETGEQRSLRVARVIDCTGFGTDITLTTDPLLQGLLRSGTARPDPLRLGLDVSIEGAVLRHSGMVRSVR